MVSPSFPQSLGRLSGDELLHKAGVFGLPAIPVSVAEARRNVRLLLSEWGISRETCDNAVLVTSELVTNALTHTESDLIVCRLRTSGDRLHVEVEDQNRSRTLPACRQPKPDDQGGRGLLLVDMLSSDWGVRDAPHGSGRIVWAELPAESMEATTPPAVPEPQDGSADAHAADPSWT
ncbi:ATP-binding protein [Streptomyces vastus]|uniref:Histidine kinase/HSP90-like ATPase domain-containing protein n=1 Tax=Streptomyces vastus TaxID=285451 RepID=A0ABN3QK70_9ACTN